MPFHLRLIDAGRIVLVRAVGPANSEEWFRLPDHRMLSLTKSRRGLLIDVRRRETLPTTEQVREMGERLPHVVASRFAAVAIVARPGAQFGLARMVDSLTELRGMPARAFTDLRPARQWLFEQTPQDPA